MGFRLKEWVSVSKEWVYVLRGSFLQKESGFLSISREMVSVYEENGFPVCLKKMGFCLSQENGFLSLGRVGFCLKKVGFLNVRKKVGLGSSLSEFLPV